MRKRIGIVTHYYDSINYGGNLQAYALCRYLNQHGSSSEQICYSVHSDLSITQGKSCFEILKMYGVWGVIRVLYTKFSVKIRLFLFRRGNNHYKKVIEARRKSFSHLNQDLTPHSEKKYNDSNFFECTDEYDIFITGSDQVWNLNSYRLGYFLEGIPDSKLKISYAASMAMNAIDDKQKNFISERLSSFYAISVRESLTVKLLNGCANKQIVQVIDPVFLLDQEEWNEVCSPCMINEDYIFCYFLGDNRNSRKSAEKFAKRHNLKIASISMASDGVRFEDRKLGDYSFDTASPENFLSLIRYSKAVFTDSFHAVAFSKIFNKQFFVFLRSDKDQMSSRIIDILNLINEKGRFCNSKERYSASYGDSIYGNALKNSRDFDNLVSFSKQFIERYVLNNEESY